ncbi:MAG TPA: hypothetical protein DCQ32_09220, partial [Cyanobacteria bacterium UBA8156]|nr:hypothetical protein [Cyanobacteria bacterium UBA8156]
MVPLTSTPPEQRIWVSADLALLPDNGDRYEIVEGELFVARAPHWQHQAVCLNFCVALKAWSQATAAGYVGMGTGMVFGDQDNVIPDVVWLSRERYTALVDESGHLRGAPELVIEVLSAGAENERRDREVKLKLYSIHGVQEYWLADWRLQQVAVYRRGGGRG